VDRLVRRGLVVRTPHPGDGRGVLVSLTDEGRSRVDAALETLLRTERSLLAGIPEESFTRLADDLRALLLAQH